MNSSIISDDPQPVAAAGRYRIGKMFTFEAAHRLPATAVPARCAGAHGHSYTVGLVLASDTLVAPGFVTDFADLDLFKRYLAQTLDHRDLNETLGPSPTRRAIEKHLTSWLEDNLVPHISGRVEAVRVSDVAEPDGHRRGGRVYRFEASHQLPGLPVDHKCARRHGHSYAVGVVLDCDTAVPAGFVGDNGGLDLFADYVTTEFNTHLNDLLDAPPTSERIAEHLAGWFAAHVQPDIADTLRSVWVSETSATWASYAPNGGVS